MYTVDYEATTKITKQRIIANKPPMELEWNNKKYSVKFKRVQTKEKWKEHVTEVENR